MSRENRKIDNKVNHTTLEKYFNSFLGNQRMNGTPPRTARLQALHFWIITATATATDNISINSTTTIIITTGSRVSRALRRS